MSHLPADSNLQNATSGGPWKKQIWCVYICDFCTYTSNDVNVHPYLVRCTHVCVSCCYVHVYWLVLYTGAVSCRVQVYRISASTQVSDDNYLVSALTRHHMVYISITQLGIFICTDRCTHGRQVNYAFLRVCLCLSLSVRVCVCVCVCLYKHTNWSLYISISFMPCI